MEVIIIKKYTILILTLILLIVLCGCAEKKSDLPEETSNVSFMAVVTELNETTMLVKPVEGSNELKSADSFTVPLNYISDNSQPKVGDTYKIEYNGYILEIYPAQLGEVYSVTLVSNNE